MYLTLNTNNIFFVKMNFILKLLDRVAVLTTTLILQALFLLQMGIVTQGWIMCSLSTVINHF